jgi:hypothetical protein
LCGGELPVLAHRPHAAWTGLELALVRKLLALGMSQTGIGRLLGVSRDAIRAALTRDLAA